MVNQILAESDTDAVPGDPIADLDALVAGDVGALARTITRLENGTAPLAQLRARAAAESAPSCSGVTGTGGSGKSSLTDELIRRLRIDQQDKLRTAVIAVDPTRRRGGGALLGDRIRMNSLGDDRVYFRSMATRGERGRPARRRCPTSSRPRRRPASTWSSSRRRASGRAIRPWPSWSMSRCT